MLKLAFVGLGLPLKFRSLLWSAPQVFGATDLSQYHLCQDLQHVTAGAKLRIKQLEESFQARFVLEVWLKLLG